MSRAVALASVSIASLLLGTAPAHAAGAAQAVVWEHYTSPRSSRTEVWIANPDGSGAHKLVSGGRPDISPDGRWVAYVSSATGEELLHVISSSGGAPRVVFFPHDDVAVGSFNWSSDSSRLVFGGQGYDGWLLAGYDPNTGLVTELGGSLRPHQVAAVPGSGEVVVLHDQSQVFLANSRGFAHRLVRLSTWLASDLYVSQRKVAFLVFRNRPLGSDLTTFVRQTELRTVDLRSRRQRRFGTGFSPVGWRPDGHTLDVFRATCTRRRCTTVAATLDADTGSVVPGPSLGEVRLRIRKLRKARTGRTRRRLTLIFDGAGPIANSTDGTAFLAEQSRGVVHGHDLEDVLLKAYRKTPLIVRIPVTGGRPEPIARGRNPDWNL